MKKIITSLFLITSALVGSAQSLVTDSLFGINGQISEFGLGQTETSNLLQQPDGKILLCGYNYDFGCNCNYNDMIRVDACGKIDSTFGVNGLVHHTFDQRNAGFYYALQPDGKILVSGTQSDGNAGSQQFPFIARYNNDGSVDSSFATNGTNKINYLGPGVFTFIYLADSGRILCTGSPNFGSNLIMRFDSTGAVDNTFGVNGVVLHATPPGVNFFYDFKSIMRSDGKIISAAPTYLGIANDKNVVLSCFDTLGVLDTTYGNNGFFIDYNFVVGTGLRILIQNDDKVIVAQQNISETQIIVARYNTNGSIDTSYGVNGYVIIPAPNGPSRLQYVSKFSDDKILIGYQENGVVPVFKKIDTNGIIDANFSLNGGNTFEFLNNGDKARVAIVSNNDELIMAGSQNGFSFTRFVLNSSVPNIIQNFTTLNANVSASGSTFQWFLNGIAITGATDSTYIFTQNGTYNVEVTNNIGCTYSDSFVVSNTAIDDLQGITELYYYPNPFSGDFNLQFTSEVNEMATIHVVDLSGKLLHEVSLNFKTGNNNIKIGSMDKLAGGIYFLRITSSRINDTIKIVKK